MTSSSIDEDLEDESISTKVKFIRFVKKLGLVLSYSKSEREDVVALDEINYCGSFYK